MAPFLAMADLERARVCSSGLTKTFALIMPWRENKGVANLDGIYTDGLGLPVGKKSLGEIFNKNMACGQKSIIGS